MSRHAKIRHFLSKIVKICVMSRKKWLQVRWEPTPHFLPLWYIWYRCCYWCWLYGYQFASVLLLLLLFFVLLFQLQRTNVTIQLKSFVVLRGNNNVLFFILLKSYKTKNVVAVIHFYFPSNHKVWVHNLTKAASMVSSNAITNSQ